MQYGQNSEGPPPRTWVNLPLIVALIVVVILGVWLITEKSGPVYNPEAAPREPASRGSLMEIEQTTNALYEKVKTSVVYITTLVRQSDIFRLNISEIPQGAGSGFIWDSDGHIVTNFHVIMKAMQSRQQVIRVTLADRTAWDAKIVGFDPEMDLAVLHIEAPSSLLKPIPLGTSNDLLVGQMVFAIGNPFGYDQTLTTGVVSALDREINSVVNTKITGVIQTDAAINPGNSGGPLLDSAGRLIGVNTSIATTMPQVRQSAGVGFAVPVDTVNIVVPQVIRGGRPGLGVTIIADRWRKEFGYGDGALIAEVIPDSTADHAELRSAKYVWRGGRRELLADLIVGLGDQKITSRDDLINALGKYKVGDVVRITIVRDGEMYGADVKLQPVF